MKKNHFIIAVLIFLSISLARDGWSGENRFQVVSTILPWGDFLNKLCDGRCAVKVLLPPGATPHTWSPRPEDIKDVSNARIFVYTSRHLEPWAVDFVDGFIKGPKKVLEIDEIQNTGTDPHIWLDFKFDQKVVEKMATLLSQVDPSGKQIYEKKAMLLKASLEELDSSYRKQLRDCRYKTIVVAGHNAFSRIGNAYGLKVLSVMGISPDAHITPRDLSRVIAFVKKEKVPAIFFDHAVTDRIAKVISTETGVEIKAISPGVSLRREDLNRGIDFFRLMFENLNALSSGLLCNQE
ncbi:Zinc ABC transporter, periplasmic-binding protein ZnuA [Dissulfuribacter thermophilus]|uniref:Zinc ABC transporter, periplasmic-binding protein ZnuA n=1 Tax=Dissulfuribacter thermophilus TaxID=1156395 RepID=A0A1B9F999_9BACT|nr:metal ABC transporter substrate-binding protein [Dissulfuribacter thermophilus]OCC16444.1 Zinc ABC transporter, periplasmic-binding protein ZnuA [Dissulfuribacter thermophilus]